MDHRWFEVLLSQSQIYIFCLLISSKGICSYHQTEGSLRFLMKIIDLGELSKLLLHTKCERHQKNLVTCLSFGFASHFKACLLCPKKLNSTWPATGTPSNLFLPKDFLPLVYACGNKQMQYSKVIFALCVP